MELFTPATHVAEAENRIWLPAWSIVAESWYGRPRLRAFADIGNVVPFSLEPLRGAVGENLMLCVAFRNGTRWVRYPLWEHALFEDLEVYTGERLGIAARIEFWTINSAAPSLPAGISLGIGQLTNQQWRCALRLANNIFLATTSNLSAYDEPCSPFFPA